MPKQPAPTEPAEALAAIEAPAAPPQPARIEPSAAVPEPTPPTGGNWLRDADGGLSPADAETAAAAGLRWPA